VSVVSSGCCNIGACGVIDGILFTHPVILLLCTLLFLIVEVAFACAIGGVFCC